MGRQRGWGISLGLVLASALAFAQPYPQAGTVPGPGTLNYVEGQFTIDGRPLTPQAARATRLQRGQVLATGQGNVELLLTPGVFLRLGNDSTLRMISPSLVNTKVELLRGTVILDVGQLYEQNNLNVVIDGATTQIKKKGLYEFDANRAAAMVFDGEARVSAGGQDVKVKGGNELLLAGVGVLQPQKFDKDAAKQEPLYRWSKLRSEYESEANKELAQNVYVYGGYGPGWYWAPYWSSYAWWPAYGYPYFGPGFGVAVGVGGFHGHGHGGHHHGGGPHGRGGEHHGGGGEHHGGGHHR